MSISDQVTKDMIAAMKSREELKLSTLRMMKSALKNKEIDKRSPLDDKEALQVLSTMIKQRKDSIEQFTKGGRQELADKEAAEITIIEAYMPKADRRSRDRRGRARHRRRDGLSDDERHGHCHEEHHGKICWRPRRRQSRQRSGEERAGWEVVCVARTFPSASFRTGLSASVCPGYVRRLRFSGKDARRAQLIGESSESATRSPAPG